LSRESRQLLVYVAGRDGLDARDAVARGGGELPAAGERLRACGGGSFRRIWTAAVRLRPPQAGAGQDRGLPWTQIHGRLVWSGPDDQDALIGAAARALRCS
jgi:hypothetical protein